jgi:hypothetical protein
VQATPTFPSDNDAARRPAFVCTDSTNTTLEELHQRAASRHEGWRAAARELARMKSPRTALLIIIIITMIN